MGCARFPFAGELKVSRIILMSHPQPLGPANSQTDSSRGGLGNPITKERATILERPWDNPEGRATAKLTALVGAPS